MIAWEDLTERGRTRRLRSLATAALAAYPVEPTRLRLIGGFTNLLFRVDTADGPLALRVDHAEDHSASDVAIELAWLAELRETDLDVCRPVPARDGSWVVDATAPGVPGSRRCVLFEWVPGRPLGEASTPERYRSLGRLSAGLHRAGATFEPPTRPMAWDRVFYWPEAVDPVVWDRAGVLSANQLDVVRRAIDAVTPAFERLDPSTAQVVHGDLHPDNVHVHRSRVIAFDFEDVMWAHRVQDVAITLFYGRNRPDYPDLRAAFEAGYRSVDEWPVSYEGELEHFMAARTIMFVNYVINSQPDPSEYFEIAVPRLARFLDRWA